MIVESQSLLGHIFDALPSMRVFHHRDSPIYQVFSESARLAIHDLFGRDGPQRANFGPIGEISIPFVSMGAINTTHLFGLDELIIFSFYARNVRNYKNVLDIGANVGLHSVVLARLGYSVQCFEPDPRHADILRSNLERNGAVSKVTVYQKAVSVEAASLEFIRVLGNTTGSHLAGAKKSPYGDLEKFSVESVAFRDVIRGMDLVKLDVEGHELEILKTTSLGDWETMDAIIEIGTPENAKGVFQHFRNIGVNMFSQKKSWARVSHQDDMPCSHREGSLFISKRLEMNWA